MRIVAFGTGAFAVPAIRALAEHIVLVVSQPDRPSGRGMHMHASPVSLVARELGIPIETPERSRAPEFVERLIAQNADFLLVASYGQILSQRLLESATRGGINLHGSILPRWRGAAPIQRCLEAGDIESGVTLMQMDRGMDTGDIIEIHSTPIGPDETYGELHDRLAELAAMQIAGWAQRIALGEYPRTSQDHAAATLAPKVERGDTELDPHGDVDTAFNRYRAFTPNPGVFVRSSTGTVKVHRARKAEGSGPAGTVLQTHPELVVAFGSGALAFIEVQPEGKKRMAGSDLANGLRIKPGLEWLNKEHG